MKRIIIALIISILLLPAPPAAAYSVPSLDEILNLDINIDLGGLEDIQIPDELQDIKDKLNPKPLTFTSYSEGVPVQIGYDETRKFWVLEATVGWRYDSITLIKLPTDQKDSLSSGTQAAQPQKEVQIAFDPQGSYSTAALIPSTMYFPVDSWGSKSSHTYYAINGAAWKTTTQYKVGVNNIWKTVNVDYTSPAEIDLGGGAYVQNLGILPNGANIPSGDFIVVFDSLDNPHIVKESQMQFALNRWAANKPSNFWGDHTYTDMWNWMKDNGVLPYDVVLSQNPDYQTKVDFIPINPKIGDYKYIKIGYPMTAQSSAIALFIPATMADTIVVNIGGSIGSISSASITAATDGTTAAELTVVVKNTGGDDYISVKPLSDFYKFTVIGDNTKFIKSGESETFKFKALVLDVSEDCNNCAKVTVTADGSDPYKGDSTKIIYGTIYDGETGGDDAKIIIKAVTATGEIISNAPIYVNGDLNGEGQVELTLPKGTYNLYSMDTDGHTAPTPKTVTMSGSDKSVKLVFDGGNDDEPTNLTPYIFGVIGVLAGGFFLIRTGVIKL